MKYGNRKVHLTPSVRWCARFLFLCIAFIGVIAIIDLTGLLTNKVFTLFENIFCLTMLIYLGPLVGYIGFLGYIPWRILSFYPNGMIDWLEQDIKNGQEPRL